MAYLIGIVSPEERALLESRGWTLEPVHEELYAELDPTSYGKVENYNAWQETLESWALVYVDSDLVEIMSGPDWEKGGPGEPAVVPPDEPLEGSR